MNFFKSSLQLLLFQTKPACLCSDVSRNVLFTEDPGNTGSRIKMKNKESQGKEDNVKQFCNP